MIEYTVIALDKNCNHTCYYIFDIDGGGDFSYRARVSGNSFFYGFKKKRNLNKKTGIRYHAHYRSCDFDIFDRIKDPNTPIVKLKSLWEFYKAIGFDYKTNEYS